MKMKTIKIYRDDQVPDSILEEVSVVLNKILQNFSEIVKGYHANIALSALNRAHAVIIADAIAEEDIPKAALIEAKALILNIQHVTKIHIMDEE